jgi:hypothetical protein
MGRKKCDFSRMGKKIIPKRTSDKELTKKIVEDQKKRKKEYNNWLFGGGNNG